MRKTMTQQYTLRDAQDRLKKLIDDAQHGKTVLILDENDRAVQLVPVVTTAKPRKAGSARGQIKMVADFDASLSDFGEYME
jgi:antitoxin (DNA-binding transcriptional repressor) of toxin-antitoxin stability system